MSPAGERFVFRELERDDVQLLATWLGRPHVQRWFREPPTVEYVLSEYGGRFRGDERTRVYVVEMEGRPIGMIQSYRVEDYRAEPDWNTAGWGADGCVGIDYLIGEEDLTGRGLGAAMIEAFIAGVIRRLYPDAQGVIADPQVANAASIGALRRAGFSPYRLIDPGAQGPPEQLMRRAL